MVNTNYDVVSFYKFTSEAYLESCQTSMTELFAKIVKHYLGIA